MAHGRAHQHLFRHLACLASRNGWRMSREVGLRYQALPYLYYYGMCASRPPGRARGTPIGNARIGVTVDAVIEIKMSFN